MTDLTKGRIFAVMQFVVLGFIFWVSYTYQRGYTGLHITKIVGVLLIAWALAVVVISVRHFNQRITPNPVPLSSAKLVRTGIYKYIRHPMYTSALLLILGWCAYFFSWISVILPFLSLGFLMIKIRFEEKQLLKKFPEYGEYQKDSHRMIPYIY